MQAPGAPRDLGIAILKFHQQREHRGFSIMLLASTCRRCSAGTVAQEWPRVGARVGASVGASVVGAPAGAPVGATVGAPVGTLACQRPWRLFFPRPTARQPPLGLLGGSKGKCWHFLCNSKVS